MIVHHIRKSWVLFQLQVYVDAWLWKHDVVMGLGSSRQGLRGEVECVKEEEVGTIPGSGEQEPDDWCRAWPARLAASEGRRMWPEAVMHCGSSRMQDGCCPKEDHLRGEAAAEGNVLEGVLDPLSASLPETMYKSTCVDTCVNPCYQWCHDADFDSKSSVNIVLPTSLHASLCRCRRHHT